MKKMYLSMFVAGTILLTACGGAEVVEETNYALDSEKTSLNWTGKYVQDGHTHTGTVNVSEGNLTYKGEEFVSGDFTIDLKTIVATDVEGEMKTNLEGHLNSPDYFNTAVNAEAKVEVTEISAKEMKATIKLMGKEVKAVMPLKIKKDDKGFTAKGKFDLDLAALNLNGFKAAAGDPAEAHPDTKISFDLNLVLKK